ncbi:class I SAM-dependent methyltransferase [Halosegnis sp.]|uniref:class I SAM-dependent methyltransferase n=1 Tax=Halosegnis sp. TaxID=2864959 RepID=UPI0035D4D37E
MSAVYDWWSRHPRALDALYAAAFLGRERRLRERSLAVLAPTAGERVLELGCGPGNSLSPLRERVGDAGAVVGVDASAGMVKTAREKASTWGNVHVVRGDACRLPVSDGAVDAVYAAMSTSATPAPAAVVRAAHDALRSGGRFVLLDAQPFQRWPARALNAVAIPVSRRLTDWVPEVDLAATVRETFADSTVETHNAGSIVIARGRKG